MKTIAAILPVAFFAVCAGCTAPRYVYTPANHNIPVFTKKFDSKIAANFVTDGGSSRTSGADSSEHEEGTSNGFDIQAAFAVTNRIALQASYYNGHEKAWAISKSHFADSRIRHKRNMMDLGAGYFAPLDKKEHLFFQLYAGVGFGKTTMLESGTDINQLSYSRSYMANMLKLFLEPSLSFRTRIAFTGTIFTRASVIKFSKVRTDFTKNEQIDLKLDSLDRYSVLFLEPGVVASLGFRRLPGIRIEVQASASILHQHSFIGYRPMNMSVGLYFDIPKLVKWQKYVPYTW